MRKYSLKATNFLPVKAWRILSGGWGSLLIFFLLLSACTQDEQKAQIAAGQSELFVSLNIPYGNTDAQSTYAMPTDEGKLEHLVVLAFEYNGSDSNPVSNTGKFLYRAGVSYNSSNPTSCKIKVKNMAQAQTFVFIANARQAVDDAILQEGVTSKEQAIQNVLMTRASETGFDGSVMTSIPMWGEAQNIVVNGDKTSIPQVSFYHSMAKINVKTDTAGGVPADLFELKQVYVYMPRINGTVIPGNWGTYTGSLPGEPTVAVSAPTEPTVTGTIPARGTKYPVYATSSNEVKDRIFVFEAKNRPGIAMLDRTCLVVGGSYKGSATNYYYRIDLAKADGTQLDILRNFIYNVNITSVNGKGYEDADEAYKSVSMNIEFEIADWNDGGMTNTEIDGEDCLNVNQSVFNLDRSQYTASNKENILIIKTSVSDGWKATLHGDAACSTASPSWISLDMTDSDMPNLNGDRVHILLTENNTATSPRKAWIKIACGRMNKIIRVEQTNELALQITPESWFEFPSGSGTVQLLTGKERTFDVLWSPGTNDINISVVRGSTATGMFSFDNGGGRDNITDGSKISGATYAGRRTYKILPTAMTEAEITAAGGFPKKVSEIQYTLTIGSTRVTRTVYVKQMHYNVIVTNLQKLYSGHNQTFTLHVNSNAKWKITDVKENIIVGTSLLGNKAGDNLVKNRTGGSDLQSSDVLVFTTTNATGSQAGKVDVKIESTDNPKKFDDITINIPIDTRTWFNGHSGWAGSNIYWDGTKLTFDDVGVTTHEKYQGVYFQWGSLYGISPAGGWAETTPIYTPSGTVQNGGAWDSWPRIGSSVNLFYESDYSPPAGFIWSGRAYLYDITDGNTGLGDICKYLTEKGWAPEGKWRMPTGSEIVAESKGYSEWTGNANASATDDGRAVFGSGRTYRAGQPDKFWVPASGYRKGEKNNNGSLVDVGNMGYFWSSSPNSTFSLCQGFHQTGSSLQQNFRAYAFPVRCVRE